MDLKRAEQIGNLYSKSNDGTIGSTVIMMLYQEVIRQREYIRFVSQEKWDMEMELDYCIQSLEKKLEERK
jgi:hypothetical protein